MTMQQPFRCTVALLLVMSFCTAASAQSIDTRCIADGGIALCTAPTNIPDPPGSPADSEMWTYNVCDFDGSFAWRNAAWTTVTGGKPIFDPDIAPVSTAFERIVNNACQIEYADSGWGQTIPYNILCWTGSPLARNGSLIRDFRKLNFTGLKPGATGCNVPWSDVVYAGKWRGVGCPKTYYARVKANQDVECWKFPPECAELGKGKVGNPITLLDGCKSQRETDYRSRRPGGVEVDRHYNSGGYFRFDVAPERATDVWRTSWDRRVVAPPVAGNVLGYAQRADGSLRVFLPNGREMHNDQGGASALLDRLVDAAGTTTGRRLTAANKDVEPYDASGQFR